MLLKRFVYSKLLPICMTILVVMASSSQVLAQQADNASPDQVHTIFLPLVSSDSGLADKALEIVAQQTNITKDALSIIDSFTIEYPLLQKMLYSFSINNVQSGKPSAITLDDSGLEVDRSQFDAEEAAAYANIGDYTVDIPAEPGSEELEEAVTASALGSSFVPYISQEHEYQVDRTGRTCLSGGIVGLQLVPINNRTGSAKLKIIVSKCNGTSFSQGGRWEVLINGTKRYSQSYSAGRTSYELPITPIKESWYDTKQSYQYQIKLFSNDAPTTPKYSGIVTADVWGRCWCTDYVYQALRLTSGYRDAKYWGPYLTGQGFRQLSASEKPKAGDVVVFPNANHVAILINQDSLGIRVRQGGSNPKSLPTKAEDHCYNKHEETWSNGNTVAYYRR